MTPLWNSFKYRDFKRILEYFGCSFVRQWKGSHEHRYSPRTDMEFPVPKHWKQELREWTLFAILRQAGISKDDIIDYLRRKK
jgi:predicted RNA binding protein YcfA (HicA-like mRNA interferase family)